ncbi:MAG: hypothetical protein A2046_11955 [Bacteroidetes bacterium GWA2_30_7]|nr:MAG: hypothetical protein A2046_11955 [Bacteroidetes bacterium GWA2_30_7]
MSYKINTSHKFVRELKRLSKKYPSLKREYAELIPHLENNPFEGTHIGYGCYKIRLAVTSKGKGESGSARIITYVYVQKETVYLISIYDKSEQANISDKEIKERLRMIE